jgi:DNA gyrase subunit A
LLVTQEGYAKRISSGSLRAGNRGDLGIQMLKFHNKTDNLVAITRTNTSQEVVLVTNKDRMLKTSVQSIPILDRDARGENIFPMTRDEVITSVVVVLETES